MILDKVIKWIHEDQTTIFSGDTNRVVIIHWKEDIKHHFLSIGTNPIQLHRLATLPWRIMQLIMEFFMVKLEEDYWLLSRC